MPVSKRSKVVVLTKTQKKPSQEKKSELIDKVHSYAAQYRRCFVFRTKNARNIHLKTMRESFMQGNVQGKLVFGKHALLKVALKTCPDMTLDGIQEDLIEVFSNVVGAQLSLFFTDADQEAVDETLASLQDEDYVRAGSVAPFDYTLMEGKLFYPLKSEIQGSVANDQVRFPLPASMAALLRTPSYGSMPTSLEKGAVHIMRDYPVCKKGEVVSVEMARVMKLLNIQYYGTEVGFRIQMLASYDKSTNEVTSYDQKE